MQKFVITITSIFFAAIIAPFAFANETYYITDDLVAYTVGGPGSQYRITGTVKAGEAVTLINTNRQTNYSLIRLANGKQSWIPSNQLSNEPSIRTLVPTLTEQVEELTNELNNINGSWNEKTANLQNRVVESETSISNLRKENERLTKELTDARKKIDNMALQMDDKQRGIIQQWFMYGGSVAIAGLLLGLLLPYITPRRKSKNHWV